MPREFDPEGIVRTLDENDVDCIYIGGWAAGLLGSPFPTSDVDITPKSSRENLTRLSTALTQMKARIRTHGVEDGLPFSHDAGSHAAVGVWNLVTRFGDFDISFVPTGTTGWPDLDQDAVTLPVYGISVRLASLADIIRSKQAANRPKDQRVLPVLREILASRYQR